jgi:hypothetical protein
MPPKDKRPADKELVGEPVPKRAASSLGPETAPKDKRPADKEPVGEPVPKRAASSLGPETAPVAAALLAAALPPATGPSSVSESGGVSVDVCETPADAESEEALLTSFQIHLHQSMTGNSVDRLLGLMLDSSATDAYIEAWGCRIAVRCFVVLWWEWAWLMTDGVQ